VGELGYQLEVGRQEEAQGLPGEERPRGAPEERLAPVQLNLALRAAPFVDFTSGLAYDRAEAFAGLGWPLARDWRLDASFSAGVALTVRRSRNDHRSAAAACGGSVRLSGGLSGLWQRAGADLPSERVPSGEPLPRRTLSHGDRH
jgi:hypothetical protein